jgi:hypothetical protein
MINTDGEPFGMAVHSDREFIVACLGGSSSP